MNILSKNNQFLHRTINFANETDQGSGPGGRFEQVYKIIGVNYIFGILTLGEARMNKGKGVTNKWRKRFFQGFIKLIIMVTQKELQLNPFRRGYHLITNNILKEIGELPEHGMLNIFLKHTSAALSVNENADPSVRTDFENFINKLIPENDPVYIHTLEGPDDMPAHLKSSLFGQSLNIPITRHKLNLGTWQGIYLCEFRNRGGGRRIVLTICS